jgi:hypothetical protein
MRQHREHQVVLPAGILTPFLVRHPELRFPCLTTLFDRPPDAAEPDQRAARGTGWRIADRVGLGRLGAVAPLAHQPDGMLREPLLTSGHAVARTVIRHRPCAPFRAWPPIPRPRRQGRGHSRDALRGAGGRTQAALRPLCAFRALGRLLGCRPLGPTARLRGDGHQGRGPHAGLKRRQTIGAMARPALGSDVPARQSPCLSAALQHRRRPLRLRLHS